jgi:hypothetical protein
MLKSGIFSGKKWYILLDALQRDSYESRLEYIPKKKAFRYVVFLRTQVRTQNMPHNNSQSKKMIYRQLLIIYFFFT